MRQTKKLMDIHSTAREEFTKIQEAMQDVRKQCVDDRRFYSIAGAQWEGELGQQFENKPKIEINKIQLSLIRIFNEYRNNRVTVDFMHKDGSRDTKLSDTLDSLYRSDEQDSSSEEAYDNAFDEAVGGGFGAFRLRAEYEDEYDEENDRQRILIEPIYDADTSVFFDLDAKKYDKSDAKHCFIISSMTRDSFTEEWGEDPSTWPKEICSTTNFDWVEADIVYIAEYYAIEEVKESIFIYKTIDGDEEKYRQEDFENDEKLEETLQAIGTTFESERKVKTRRVRKYIMSGNSILEDSGYIAGKNIPVIPVYGKRWFIDNIEQCMGHVRLAKDAQRLKNMQMSKLAEIASLSTVEKPILTPEQITNHQLMWEEDNIKNYPYLLINPVKDANGNFQPVPPIAYTRVPNVPPAMAALLQITDTDIKELLGSQESGEKILPNMSGKAVELIQNKLDMQVFIYMSNMSKSIKRSGEVWLSMAQELFIEEGRKMKGLGSKGDAESIELMKPVSNPDTGAIEYENDLSSANFDVSVSVGPSSDSKRAATVRAVTGMMSISQGDPEMQQALLSVALANMEGEGIQDIRDFSRQRGLRSGVFKPTEEESEQLQAEAQNQPEDPNKVYLEAAAQEAEAKAAKARADTILTVSKSENTKADTQKKEAETAETLSKMREEETNRAIEAATALGTLNNENPDDLTSE